MRKAARGGRPFRSASRGELVGSAGRRALVLVVLAAILGAIIPGSVSGAIAEADEVTPLADVTSPQSTGNLAAWHESARETLLAEAEQGGASLAQASSGSGVISGSVGNEEGTGLAGICVAALTAPLGQGDPAAVVLSQSAGHYSLTGLAPDTYRLFFFDCQDDPIYAYEYFPASSVYADAAPIDLGEGQNLDGADALLPLGATVSGTVVDADNGSPVPGICAASFDAGFRIQLAVATDSMGHYTMGRLRAGEHKLVFLDCSETPEFAVAWWNGKASFASGDSLHLTSGQNRVGVHARVAVGGKIAGSIVMNDGSPAAGVCAAVVATDGGVITYDVTSSSGSYIIPGVPSGEHRVMFVDCSSAVSRFEGRWYDGKDSFETSDVVAVQALGTTAGIDAKLTPSATVPPPGGVDADGDPDISICPDGEIPPSGFVDISGNAHEAAIDCVAWLEIALGVSPEHYAPSRFVQRDQMASFLIRLIEALGFDVPPASDQGFTDIAGNTHADRINQLAELGVTTGRTPTTYDPAVPVGRDQMASFLVRAIEMVSDQEMPSAGPYFDDTGSSIHEPNIDKVAEAEISLGVGDGTRYDPQGQVRRDQMASFLARSLEYAIEIVVPSSASGANDTAALSSHNEFHTILQWQAHGADMTCNSTPGNREIRIHPNSSDPEYRAWLYRWNPSSRQWDVYAYWNWRSRLDTSFVTDPPPGYYSTWVQGYNGWTNQYRWLVPVRFFNFYFGPPPNWQWCHMRERGF